MTDLGDGPDADMGVLVLWDVVGQVEFSCTIDNTKEDCPNQSAPRTNKTIIWRYCNPVHSEIRSEFNAAKNIWEITIYFARNSYLRQKLQKDLSFSLTVEELKVFEWILFFSSHHHLSQSKLYWRRGDDALFPLFLLKRQRLEIVLIK